MSDIDSTSNTFIFPEKVGPFRKSLLPVVERYSTMESWFYYSNYFSSYCVKITKNTPSSDPDLNWIISQLYCKYTDTVLYTSIFSLGDPSLVLAEINRLALADGK